MCGWCTACAADDGAIEVRHSFTHAGMCRLFDDSYQQHDLTIVDPVHDAARRGIVGAGFDTPALDNYVAHFDVYRAHASRYLGLYYGSDGDLRDDGHVQAWLDELGRLTPGGIVGVLGPTVTLDSVARLVAVLIYLATTHHEILGTGMWNDQIWTHVQPVRVYADGGQVPVDVYQRLVNANFLLNVRRTPLMQDFSSVALDVGGAGAFRSFNDDLRGLQAAMEQEPAAAWKVYTEVLEANINADQLAARHRYVDVMWACRWSRRPAQVPLRSAPPAPDNGHGRPRGMVLVRPLARFPGAP